jgi:hypothetical protein
MTKKYLGQFLLVLSVAVLYSCTPSLDYKIERKFKSLINNENCQIEFYYPSIEVKETNPNVTELNDLLERLPDYKYYGHNCDEMNGEKRKVIGDYTILLQTKDILSIEFTTQLSEPKGPVIRTIYHSLVLDPNKISDGDNSRFKIEPKSLFPNFDRGVLKKYVDNFSKTNNKHVNLLAYESGSRHVITWGLTKDKFILYVGGEGEAYGYDKIEISIDEVKNISQIKNEELAGDKNYKKPFNKEFLQGMWRTSLSDAPVFKIVGDSVDFFEYDPSMKHVYLYALKGDSLLFYTSGFIPTNSIKRGSPVSISKVKKLSSDTLVLQRYDSSIFYHKVK